MSDTAINLFDATKPETREGISITTAAEDKVRELVDAEDKPGIGLRLTVTAGGCSGYSYGLYFDDSTDPNDHTIEADGFNIYVDANSYPMLNGASVDYVDTLQGSGFKIENPNATGTCGCGSSFTA
ncbi:MAG: iron-sulfur cluster insertion protein ErpA [Nitrospinaceae bacterium]|jgi:iron-sulfur cluster insertion protein|nr:iron-sulfur cluster insertion protein ErpA [Nitrospinaceae bacterium]MBT3432804.1 iron-sulfur cluster insertion protein ErpA [Nitrospinaceae bacterium]MBT3822181.1 iron-sulfur cluster insertion protein ErpA [Nitrospinaceae bacterium]MBT4095670.1 iron-sulfur cluster insertion protein ErpA [Nitrospinaceae bacterium]MBT4430524.1 iron-sulfur cluster insertion protein ErpA [Nitrospinaceae bacterium]